MEGQGFRRQRFNRIASYRIGMGDRGEMASACSTPADELLL